MTESSPRRPATWIIVLLGGMLSLFLAGRGVAEPIRISWTNNVLTLSSEKLPGGKVEAWYLEAFLRPGANGRDWRQSVLPHKTVLTRSSPDGTRLEFLTTVATNIEVRHVITSTDDELDIRFELTNHGPGGSDLQWFQPACIRVAEFTGRGQQDFIKRTFIYTTNGLSTLEKTGRTTNALYLGGQVFPMNGVESRDANPRPIARLSPSNGLIGCFSADDRWILATASDRTHELFEGVYVCIHSDPAVNGLGAGETKRIRQKIYLVPNDAENLLRRYQSDFPQGR